MSPGSAPPPRLAIALCADFEVSGRAEVGPLARELERFEPGAHVEIVPDLCHGPDRAADVISRAHPDRLLLGVCTRPQAPHDFQALARRAGLDPFALEFVELGGAPDLGTATRIAAAAIARLRAFSGSRPEQLKLRLLSFEHKRSRRSLFTLPPSTYEPVASVDRGSCIGEERCGLCVSACPFGAIAIAGSKAAVDREACASCGVCVTSCPAGAIELPGASLSQVEAEISVLLEAEAPRLVFACRGARQDTTGGTPLSAGWLPVEVPCLGMVTPGWILQVLARGASAVALLGCGERCHSGRAAAGGNRVDFVRELLSLLGETAAAQRVSLLAGGVEPPPPPAAPVLPGGARGGVAGGGITLLEPAATAEAVAALAERHRAGPDVSLVHSGSPLGIVSLREETCTACGACATVCPTGALRYEEDAEGEAVVSLEAAHCIACGKCVPACPEGAFETLGVRAGVELAGLAAGRIALKRAASARCRRCGGAIAPEAMLSRIRTLLEGEEASAPLLSILTELCSDCRALH